VITVDTSGPVSIVRMQAPKANSMNPAFLDALERALDELLEGDPRPAVITGQGKVFCAGLALPELIELPRDAMDDFIDRFESVMLRLLEHPMPLVAAVNGAAAAGGCVLALMCDARVMSAGKIGLNEAQLAIGLPTVVVEGLRLRVPAASISEIAFGGALYDPEPALRLGLVDEVCAPELLETRAIARATTLGTGGAIALLQMKPAIVRPAVEAIRRNRDGDRALWVSSWFSDEGQRRVRATVDKLMRK
jgi:enoyl-CoA hydratase